jgi:hypothetical protein
MLNLAVEFRYLIIQGPQIIQVSDAKEASRHQIDYPRNPFAHVKAVYAEQTEKCQQKPCSRVVEITAAVLDVGLAVHGGDQKKVDDPANKQEPKRKEPDGSRDWLAVVKTMRAREPENPQDVAD